MRNLTLITALLLLLAACGNSETKEKKQNKAEQINVEDAIRARYIGTSSGWTIKLYNNYGIKMLPSGGENVRFSYLENGEITNKPLKELIKQPSPNNLTFKISEYDKENTGTVTITRKPCKDGEYPYTFSLIWDDGRKLEGCGPKNKKKKDKQTENTENSKTPDHLKIEDFETFWKKFQNIVANDDIDAFMHLCTSEFKSRFGKERFERFFDARMKQEIKNTTASDIKGNSKNKKFGFMENNSLITIYFIKGVDGVWRISGIGAAG